MLYVNDWREIIDLPIVAEENRKWSYRKLENILFQSIKICAYKCLKDNNGDIHTTLSGGLDSSLCLALIRRIISPNCPIHTYTIGGSEKHPDILFARKVSQFFDSIHHEFIPGTQEVEEARSALKSLFGNYRSEDLGVFLMYKFIAEFHPHSVIAHDGIDELLGGYWKHRAPREKMEKTKMFKDFWSQLENNHLLPLEKIAADFNISLVFPYLQKRLIEYITRIPVEQRTNRNKSKIPLRDIAEKYLPFEVIKRKKRGFNGALDSKVTKASQI